MTSSRYYRQIIRIINSVSATPRKPTIYGMDGYDIANVLYEYLDAKQTTEQLTADELGFMSTIDSVDDIWGGFRHFYADPTIAQTFQPHLNRIYDYEDSGPDVQILSFKDDTVDQETDAMGAKLSKKDFDLMSVVPKPGWVELPYFALADLLSSAPSAAQLGPEQLRTIYGDDVMVDEYCRVFQQLQFEPIAGYLVECLSITGTWLPWIFRLLTPETDPQIKVLIITWLKWYKHDKTFCKDPLASEGLSSIRHAKQMIALLSRQQYDSVKPLLLTKLGGFSYY